MNNWRSVDGCWKPAGIPMSRSAQCRVEAPGSCSSTDRTQKNKQLQMCPGMWEFALQSFQQRVVSCRQASGDVTGRSGLSPERQADGRSGRVHWEPEIRCTRSSVGKRGCLGFQFDPPRCIWMFPAGKDCSGMLLCFPSALWAAVFSIGSKLPTYFDQRRITGSCQVCYAGITVAMCIIIYALLLMHTTTTTGSIHYCNILLISEPKFVM